MKDSFVALDLETTGLSPEKCYILEIGALKVEDGQIIDTYETFVKCPVSIEPRIQELTGITDEMVRDGMEEKDAIGQLLDFCGSSVLLGHNIRFDYSFVKTAAQRYGLQYEAQAVDTLKIARKLLPGAEKKSLEYLCGYYGIETDTSHRALEDARAAMELYWRLEREPGFDKNKTIEHMFCKIKKSEPITKAQIKYLTDLLNYHGIEAGRDMLTMSKSEASRKIDEIIREHGRIQRFYSKS